MWIQTLLSIHSFFLIWVKNAGYEEFGESCWLGRFFMGRGQYFLPTGGRGEMSYYTQCHLWGRCNSQDKTLKLGRKRQSKAFRDLEEARLPAGIYPASRLKPRDPHIADWRSHILKASVSNRWVFKVQARLYFLFVLLWTFLHYYQPWSP